MISTWSLLALVIIVASVVIAFRGMFLAVGSLVVANIAVHLLSSLSKTVAVCSGQLCQPGVHTPADVTGVATQVQHDLGLHPELVAAADPWGFMQLFTHMFVHGDFMHLLGNLIVLLAFALPFEERIGHRRFLLAYLATGLAAAGAQLSTLWGTTTLMIGASGAVFGIIGAFAAAYPRLVIPLPLPLGFIMIFVRMRVVIAAAVFAGMQFALQSLSRFDPSDNTAYLAHLGGLAFGLLLGRPLIKNLDVKADSRIDPEKLAPFVVDESGRRAYQGLLENQDEPELFEAWLEKFLDHARAPNGAGLALRKGELVSTRGERFNVSR